MCIHAFRAAILLILVVVGGCQSQEAKPAAEPKKEGIFGKTTQEIGVFDPNAKQVVSDQKIHATDPVTGPLSAYGPMAEKVSILAVDQAIQIFNAIEGRYPKDHAEFMEKVIRANGIKLPVLPYHGEYRYNEQKHELIVVYPEGSKPGQ